MRPIALFDLDGTLAAYHDAMIEALARMDTGLISSHIDLIALENEPHMKARMDAIKRIPGWWRDLRKLDDGFRLLKLLRGMGCKIHIATRGPKKNVGAWAEKAEWVLKHIEGPYEMTVTTDKTQIDGDILVDDWPSYAEPWLAKRPTKLVLMPDRHWNRDFSHWRVVRCLPYDVHYTDVRKRLEEFLLGAGYGIDRAETGT